MPTHKGTELAQILKCKFLESSAKDRINVTESFFELVQAIKAYRVIHTPKDADAQKKSDKKRLCAVL